MYLISIHREIKVSTMHEMIDWHRDVLIQEHFGISLHNCRGSSPTKLKHLPVLSFRDQQHCSICLNILLPSSVSRAFNLILSNIFPFDSVSHNTRKHRQISYLIEQMINNLLWGRMSVWYSIVSSVTRLPSTLPNPLFSQSCLGKAFHSGGLRDMNNCCYRDCLINS